MIGNRGMLRPAAGLGWPITKKWPPRLCLICHQTIETQEIRTANQRTHEGACRQILKERTAQRGLQNRRRRGASAR